MELDLIKEGVRISLGIELYDTQIKAIKALLKGNIINMYTGEGKTIVTACYSVIKALQGNVVHIATVNQYLADTGYKDMKPLYEYFNIPVGLNDTESDKDLVYSNSVIYSKSSDLIFDYLKSEIGQKGIGLMDCVIIDEIDFTLIDNADSKFTISSGSELQNVNINMYRFIDRIFKTSIGAVVKYELGYKEVDYGKLDRIDYIFYEYDNSYEFTDNFWNKIENIFPKNLEEQYYKVAYSIAEARLCLKKDRDYKVIDGRIVLKNIFNGRLSINSRRQEGLHEAIELKEELSITPGNNKSNSMSYQVFFSLYNNLTGLSGTSWEIRKEMKNLFNVDTIKIKRNKENRVSKYDTTITETKYDKMESVIGEIKSVASTGRPILIIASDEVELYIIKDMISGHKIGVIDSLSTKEEPGILDKAGLSGSITLSTYMTGRGSDIKLSEPSKALGGLHIIIMNRFKSKRIDNQVVGRTARNGNPGSYRFIISKEDRIVKSIESKKLKVYKDKSIERKININQKILDNLGHRTREYNFYFGLAILDIKKYLIRILEIKKLSIDLFLNTWPDLEIQLSNLYLDCSMYDSKPNEILYNFYKESKLIVDSYISENIGGIDELYGI